MDVAKLDDRSLIINYLKGNEKCFEILLTRHRNKIYTSIYLFVRDRDLAEDIFQDVFIKLLIHFVKVSTTMKASFFNGQCVSLTICV